MKPILLSISFFLFMLTTQAQRAGGMSQEKKQQLQELRNDFFTKKLNLTVEESKKFFPVYEAYFEELKTAKKADKTDVLSFEEQVLNIRKKYLPQFKQTLGSSEKANEVFKTEKEFRAKLMREMHRRHGGEAKPAPLTN